jgi:hypothetical protein
LSTEDLGANRTYEVVEQEEKRRADIRVALVVCSHRKDRSTHGEVGPKGSPSAAHHGVEDVEVVRVSSPVTCPQGADS